MVAVNIGKLMEDVSAFHDLKVLSEYYGQKKSFYDDNEMTPSDILSDIDKRSYQQEGYSRKYREIVGKISKLKDSFDNEEYRDIVSLVEEVTSACDAVYFSDATNRRDTLYISRENLSEFIGGMQMMSYYEFSTKEHPENSELAKQYADYKDQFYEDFSYPVLKQSDLENEMDDYE